MARRVGALASKPRQRPSATRPAEHPPRAASALCVRYTGHNTHRCPRYISRPPHLQRALHSYKLTQCQTSNAVRRPNPLHRIAPCNTKSASYRSLKSAGSRAGCASWRPRREEQLHTEQMHARLTCSTTTRTRSRPAHSRQRSAAADGGRPLTARLLLTKLQPALGRRRPPRHPARRNATASGGGKPVSEGNRYAAANGGRSGSGVAVAWQQLH